MILLPIVVLPIWQFYQVLRVTKSRIFAHCDFEAIAVLLQVGLSICVISIAIFTNYRFNRLCFHDLLFVPIVVCVTNCRCHLTSCHFYSNGTSQRYVFKAQFDIKWSISIGTAR